MISTDEIQTGKANLDNEDISNLARAHQSDVHRAYGRVLVARNDYFDAEGEEGPKKAEKMLEAQDAHDARLWRAHEFKNEHLDQLIEVAKEDAEAAGVEVNLPQAKE